MVVQTTKIMALLFFFLLASLFGCSPKGFSTSENQSSFNKPDPQNPNEDSEDQNIPADPNQPDAYLPLSWEKSVNDSVLWSLMLYRLIQTEQPVLLETKVSDITTFCPRYESLHSVQKINFWGQLIAAIARFESGWKPVARYVETTMGDDAVTGEQIASEGLLQLSYQDAKYTPSFCKFDWAADKSINAKNPLDARKTIFDPYRNLRCGLAILAKQIKSKKAIAVDKGAYWAVIKLGNSNNKIEKISALTKSLSFCQ